MEDILDKRDSIVLDGKPIGAGMFGCVIRIKDDTVVKLQIFSVEGEDNPYLPKLETREFEVAKIISSLKKDDPFIIGIQDLYYVPFNAATLQKVGNTVRLNDKCQLFSGNLKSATTDFIDMLNKQNEIGKQLPEKTEVVIKEILDQNLLPAAKVNSLPKSDVWNRFSRLKLLIKGTMWSSSTEEDIRNKLKDLMQKLPDVDYVEESSYPIIVVTSMEFANGGDLTARLKTGNPIPIDQINHLYFQLLYGLYGLQKNQPIANNDIKPDNIFVKIEQGDNTFNLPDIGSYTIKKDNPHMLISDFGLASTTVETFISPWLNGSHGFINPAAVMYRSNSTDYVGPALPKGPDHDVWSMSIVFWVIGATGIDGFKNASITGAFNISGKNYNPKSPLKEVIDDIYQSYAQEGTESDILLKKHEVAAAIIISAWMKSLGHGIVPPDSVTIDDHIFTLGPLGLAIKQKENDIGKAIDQVMNKQNYFENLSNQVKNKIGSANWSVLKGMASWLPREYDNGKFVLSLIKSLNVPNVFESSQPWLQQTTSSGKSSSFDGITFHETEKDDVILFNYNSTKNIYGVIPRYFTFKK